MDLSRAYNPSVINNANAYASLAEEYTSKGLYAKAVEAHFQAAEYFLLAIEQTTDIEAIRTLRLLHANHTRQGKEIQRRLQLQQPQKFQNSKSTSQQSLSPQSIRRSETQRPYSIAGYPSSNQNVQSLSRYVGEQNSNSQQRLNASDLLNFGRENDVNRGKDNIGLNASSYYMMNSGVPLHDDVMDDPFHRFWDAVEKLVANNQSQGNIPQSSKQAIKNEKPTDSIHNSRLLNSYFVIPDPSKATNPSLNRRKGDVDYVVPMSDNFSMSTASIDSQYFRRQALSGPIKNKSIEELAIENEQLKQNIESLLKRLSICEKAAEENNFLKNSIIQFRHEFQQKQAKRMMQSTTGISASILNPSSSRSLLPNSAFRAPLSASVPAQVETPVSKAQSDLEKKVAEMENELKLLQEKYEEQAQITTKYKERWDKVKEHAKKRKESKKLTLEVNSPIPSTPSANVSDSFLDTLTEDSAPLPLPNLPMIHENSSKQNILSGLANLNLGSGNKRQSGFGSAHGSPPMQRQSSLGTSSSYRNPRGSEENYHGMGTTGSSGGGVRMVVRENGEVVEELKLNSGDLDEISEKANFDDDGGAVNKLSSSAVTTNTMFHSTFEY
ncbi:hypothetical protein HK098_004547 [Nowakowskiella sp. JEL0407]|nr:hypothetical protein HK098_004547 [Nowakowskiella sp. JEL0407]